MLLAGTPEQKKKYGGRLLEEPLIAVSRGSYTADFILICSLLTAKVVSEYNFFLSIGKWKGFYVHSCLDLENY